MQAKLVLPQASVLGYILVLSPNCRDQQKGLSLRLRLTLTLKVCAMLQALAVPLVAASGHAACPDGYRAQVPGGFWKNLDPPESGPLDHANGTVSLCAAKCSATAACVAFEVFSGDAHANASCYTFQGALDPPFTAAAGCTACVNASFAPAARCATDKDCSLNGVCGPSGGCACDPGWHGGACELLALGAAPAGGAYGFGAPFGVTSWGGNAIRDSGGGGDGLWHLCSSRRLRGRAAACTGGTIRAPSRTPRRPHRRARTRRRASPWRTRRTTRRPSS
jgi:hypothetical protein